MEGIPKGVIGIAYRGVDVLGQGLGRGFKHGGDGGKKRGSPLVRKGNVASTFSYVIVGNLV